MIWIYGKDEKGQSVLRPASFKTLTLARSYAESKNQDGAELKVYEGDSFPPLGKRFENGELRTLTIPEAVARGERSIPEGFKLFEDQIVQMTEAEEIRHGLLDYEALRKDVRNEVDALYNEHLTGAVGKYPPARREAWPFLVGEAKAWIAEPVETRENIKPKLPLLMNEVGGAATEQEITSLAQRAITKATLYAIFSGSCTRELVRVHAALDAVPYSGNPETFVSELQAIKNGIDFPELETE